ncbi:MAG: hypothetical protein JW843_08205 [Candidatus Aminicenantes bacterium]|nr:hypothetical protein [Candidatus Aminicenantes bacterium]
MKRILFLPAAIFFAAWSVSSAQVVLKDAERFQSKREWRAALGYDPARIFSLRFRGNSCPLVEVKIDGQSFWLTFDFGSSGGMLVTTAIEEKIKYEFVRELKTSYADGRPRGSGKEVILNRVEAFGKTFERVVCDLFDWKIFSSAPNDGAISLEYIENTRFTLDYREKILAVTEKPFPEVLMTGGGLISIPLLISPDWNKYGLYLKGTVNGRETIIYIDNGSSHTIVDPGLLGAMPVTKSRGGDICASEIPVSIGGLDLRISRFRVAAVRRKTSYDLPVGIKIGSDLLRHFVLTVDRTPGRNLLIVHR